MIRNMFLNFKKYKFLMNQLIIRDFKVKYKRSVLGVLWSILYPLLMMIVMAVIFSNVFKFNMQGVNYLVYLMTGLVVFNYFSEATSNAMGSIFGNASLINKVYIPKYIFPVAKCLFVGINFLFSLIPLFLIVIFSGNELEGTKCYFSLYYLVLPYIFLCIFIFTLGIGYILASISVFLRDMVYIWGILTTILNYFTPIFYDISMLPPMLQNILKFNPLYIYINSFREIVLNSNMPSVYSLSMCLFTSIITLFIGMIVFKKTQNKFIFYM